MKKNIIILILVVILAIIIVNDRNSKDYSQNAVVETSQDSVTAPTGSVKDTKVTGESLNLSGKGLDKLPSYVLDRTSLQELDISDNNLTGALPAEIRHLKNLKVLNASNNRMTGVPAEIGQLAKLEVLNLANNQLTGLPNEMANLKNLKTLDLSGNDYSAQDLDVIKKGLPSDVLIVY